MPDASFGSRDGALWLRVLPLVATGMPAQWILDVNYAELDRIDVGSSCGPGRDQHFELGIERPFQARALRAMMC